jgi:hypothetical protein
MPMQRGLGRFCPIARVLAEFTEERMDTFETVGLDYPAGSER